MQLLIMNRIHCIYICKQTRVSAPYVSTLIIVHVTSPRQLTDYNL